MEVCKFMVYAHPSLKMLCRVLSGVAVAKDGTLLISDTFNNRIRAVSSTTRAISTVAGNGLAAYAGNNQPAVSASLNSPAGIAVGPDGSVFVADALNHVVRCINATTKAIRTVAGSGQYGSSGDLNLPTLAKLSNPRGVAVGSDGTVYIADSDNNKVRKVQ